MIFKLGKAVTCVESCYSLAVARSKSVVAKVLGRAAGRSDAGNSGGYGRDTNHMQGTDRREDRGWRLKPMRVGDAPRSDMLARWWASASDMH